jgi:hypothetical protein
VQNSLRYGQIGRENQKNSQNGNFSIRAFGTAISCNAMVQELIAIDRDRFNSLEAYISMVDVTIRVFFISSQVM